MSSPTIARPVLQKDQQKEYNSVFQYHTLPLANIAAEHPRRYKREVLSTGLLHQNNHWYKTNYTLEIFEGIGGNVILVQLLAVACNMFLSEDLHNKDRRFIEEQLIRLRHLEKRLVEGREVSMDGKAFLRRYQEDKYLLPWKMELLSIVDTVRTMA